MVKLIIRRSKIKPTLFLIQTIENIYKIFFNGVEKYNNIEYNATSDQFNIIEQN